MHKRYTYKLLGLVVLFTLCCSFFPFTGGNTTKLIIKSLDSTNEGAPFYVYVKEVEKSEFLKDEYQQIVREAFPFTKEGPESHPHVIIPGKNYKIRVPRESKEKMLGLYFLFTAPGDDWKLLVTANRRVDVVLGDTEILSAKSR